MFARAIDLGRRAIVPVSWTVLYLKLALCRAQIAPKRPLHTSWSNYIIHTKYNYDFDVANSLLL